MAHLEWAAITSGGPRIGTLRVRGGLDKLDGHNYVSHAYQNELICPQSLVWLHICLPIPLDAIPPISTLLVDSPRTDCRIPWKILEPWVSVQIQSARDSPGI